MTEEERVAFKEAEKERTRKAVQTDRSKKKDSMTPENLQDYKKKEAFRIKALRDKKISTQHSKKEKAKVILKVTKKPSNPYKNMGRKMGGGAEKEIWTEGGRKRVWKYFITMFLKEAYATYLESCEKDDNKCSLSTFFNFRPKNVLLLDESPKQQCKCQIRENLFLNLEAMGICYEKDWGNIMLYDSTPNSDCWQSMFKECIDGQKIVPSKSLASAVSYKQWEKLEVPSQSKDTETYEKICIISKDCQVGEVVERFQEAYGRVKEHQNTKIIHAAEFQTYKSPQKTSIAD